MSSYRIGLQKGTNFISIPLDMTSPSYENDPKELFSPNIMTEFSPTDGFSGDYMFTHISDGDKSIHNYSGEWEGDLEWDSITPTKALIVYCNHKVIKTFNGDEISDPSILQYDLLQGWNYLSFPYQKAHPFGEGDYTTGTAVDYIMNTIYLSGSGHADACIDKVFQKYSDVSDDLKKREYDGSGDNSTDWIGDLEEFKPFNSVWVHCTKQVDNATIWDNSTTTLETTYNFLQGTTGVTIEQTDGNRGLNTWSDLGYEYNPYYDENQLVFHVRAKYNPSTEMPFKIKDASGTDILKVTGTGYISDRTMVASSIGYVMGFFVERLFNVDSQRPNWGNRGYLKKVIQSPQMNSAGSSDLTIEAYGMEHYSPIPSMGITVDDLPMFTASSPLHGTSQKLQKFSDYIGGDPVGFVIALSRDTTNQDMPLLGDYRSKTGFRIGDKIVPVIYDPTAQDGERYRYCKYYPHTDDQYWIDNGGWNGESNEIIRFKDEEQYHDIFYDIEGNLKYDPVLGEPYIEPVYKKIPYKIIDPEHIATHTTNMILSGVVQML